MRTWITLLLFLLTPAATMAADALPPCVADMISIEEKTPATEIYADYPAVRDPAIRRIVRDWVQETIHSFKIGVAEIDFEYDWTNMLEIDPVIAGIPGEVLSLKFDIMHYQGGAHPSHYVKTMNFDLATQKDLGLSDIFSDTAKALEIISADARTQLRAALGDFFIEDWSTEGTAPIPENYVFFALGPMGITFYFPHYQVTAYAAGQQHAVVEWNRLTPLLTPKAARWLQANQ